MPAPWCAGTFAEAGILQPATQLIVGGNMSEIAFQTERLQYPRVYAECNGGVAAFDSVQGLAGNAGTLRHCLRRVRTPQAGLTNMLTQLAQQTGETRQ